MATEPAPRNKDWTDYFSAKGGGDLQEYFDEPLDSNDEITMSYLLDGDGLLDTADLYPNNWVLIPGPAKTIRLFHSCFSSVGRFIGVLGCRSTAPFKQINLTGAAASLSVPPQIRGDPLTVPTLAQFLSISDEEEFSVLVGTSEKQVSSLSNRPNSFWIHPHLFLAVSGPQSVRAAEMAVILLLSIQEDSPGDIENPSDDELGIYELLIFLWAVEKRWAIPVLIQDPSDSPETSSSCEAVAKRLESWRLAEDTKKSKDSDEEEESLGDSKRRRSSKKKKPSPRKRKSRDSSSDESSDEKSKPKRKPNRKDKTSSSYSGSSSDSVSSRSRSHSKKGRSPRRRTHNRNSRKSPDSSPSSSSGDSSTSSSPSRRGARGRRSRRKPRRSSRRSSRRSKNRRRGSDSSEDLRVEVMQSLVEMSRFQRKAYKRDSRKKSMLNRLPEEQVKLYTLLSARDWHDTNPKINSFTEDLLSDRDPERAWNHLETVSRDWPGEVSKTGLIHFLSKGFRASDVDESPGGFTAFMFSSVDVDKKISRKDRELAIRSVFGEDTVTDEVVRYYAKNDLFLAASYEDAKNQLRTCLKCLEKLTHRDSIGTDGYSYGIDLLSKHRRKFMKESRRDPQIYIKFVYMLDRVFQNFVSRLGGFHRERQPIRHARGSLRGSMRADIDQALGGFDSGVIPNLSLPEVISNNNTVRDDPAPDKSNDGKKGGKKPDDLTSSPSWWSTNAEKVPEWGLPVGKNYRDFFTPDHKENFTNWPTFQHHRHPKVPDPKPLCIKYQTSGSCRAGCRLAHVKPSSMESAIRTKVDARFKEVYKSA
jgi:hypothetical protein